MYWKVNFNEISSNGTQYDINDISWLSDNVSVRGDTASGKLILTRKSENRVELKGHLDLEVDLFCDRCLDSFIWPICTKWQLIIECQERDHWHVKEMECTDLDLETITLKEPVVDLGDILRQQLYLSLPVKKVCNEDCRGLCPNCGINLNRGQCNCLNRITDSHFSVLSQLKKK